MKYIFSLLLPVLLSGCSAALRDNYLIGKESINTVNADLYDWETFFYAGVTIGTYRPKQYGYTIDGEYYFLYPARLSGVALIGPPIVPIIPAPQPAKGLDQFDLRYFDPSSRYENPPIRIVASANGSEVDSCIPTISSTDVVGQRLTCARKGSSEDSQPDTLVVTHKNRHRIEIELELITNWGYSPIFSFNGPNPEPELTIEVAGEKVVYPN